jgi:hypothetical protein
MTTGSRADRLDLAVERLLAGENVPSERGLGPLFETAALVRAALPPVPSAQKFEERLGARLAHAGVAGAVDAIEAFARRELRHPGRILAAGAVSSAAVGVTVTAVAVWFSRRHAAAASRSGRQAG